MSQLQVACSIVLGSLGLGIAGAVLDQECGEGTAGAVLCVLIVLGILGSLILGACGVFG